MLGLAGVAILARPRPPASPPAPLHSRPVGPRAERVARVEARHGTIPVQDGRKALKPSDLPPFRLGLDDLPEAERSALATVLNRSVGPCGSCWTEGWSIATCAVEHRCEAAWWLVETGRRLAAGGADEEALRSALALDLAWVDPARLPLPGPAPPAGLVPVIVAFEPTSPFNAQGLADLLEAGGDAIAVRLAPYADPGREGSARLARQGWAAARLGAGLAWARAVARGMDPAPALEAAGVPLEAWREAAAEAGEPLEALGRALAAVGVRSSPTFIVGRGWRVRGLRGVDYLRRVIALDRGEGAGP